MSPSAIDRCLHSNLAALVTRNHSDYLVGPEGGGLLEGEEHSPDGRPEGSGEAGGGTWRGDQSTERKVYIPGGGTNQLRGKCIYLEGAPIN
eukprot:4564652-Pyramimonas_sp.AAC.1